MPLFALANAGVTIEASALETRVVLAVASGLVLGKVIGIFLFSWVSVRAGLARLPAGMTWSVLAGAACLGGIGFTMSLFIAGLAFTGPLHEEAKIGILVGSVISGAVGCLVLVISLPREGGSVFKSDSIESIGERREGVP
jgi:NhaA family Na+:H+ antiporter